MCHKVNCSTCKKATWSGCGMHIQSALQGVPEEDRCAGWKTGRCPDAAQGSTTSKTKGTCTTH